MAGNRTNFQVGLQFTADTAQAKKQLQDLQKSLNELTSKGISEGFSSKPITRDLEVATADAIKLQTALQGAVNTNTGKLDISKFNNSLKSAGLTIPQLRENLSKFGAEGNKVFEQLAVSITKAEKPALQLGNLANKLLYSFAQTARYQFSSSIYRGLVGGIRSAYSYAQDLNESLNRIRIVTGQSTDQMAKFAETANKAAQSLSVTTTEYTKGALIYYQQGLSDEEVKARTDVTMKLANASGVSAETASQQLTAIWNNFAKGSKDLEYFADVMVKLGATTASSTSEIAEGLEKFAAIGETVGLSYNYAAAALATVTATTRQSADVVGTAFKTLFARIQDLEVGETLEDGTTLGKYSQALAAIGINIKDANGDLKDMDKILDEMGSKWSTLSRDMQTAVAQTVAGTRQYTQLVALMENWDFMQRNINTAQSARGSLEEQQQTYSEGWEAARDRVKAALQDIYQDLIDDKFFIDLLNFAKNLLNTIDTLIKHIGGLPGVLTTIGSLITTFGFQTVANGIDRAIQNIKVGLGIAGKEFEKLKSETLKELTQLNIDEYGPEYAHFYKAQLDYMAKLEKARQNMTEDEAKSIENLSAALFAKGEELRKEIEITKEKQEQLKIDQAQQQLDSSKQIYQTKAGVGSLLNKYNVEREKEISSSVSYKLSNSFLQDFRMNYGNRKSAEAIQTWLNTPELENHLNNEQNVLLQRARKIIDASVEAGVEVEEFWKDVVDDFRESIKNSPRNYTIKEWEHKSKKGIEEWLETIDTTVSDDIKKKADILKKALGKKKTSDEELNKLAADLYKTNEEFLKTPRIESYTDAKIMVSKAISKNDFSADTSQNIINAFDAEIKAGGVPQEVIDSFNKYKELVESGEKDTEKLKEALEKLQETARKTKIQAQPLSLDSAISQIDKLNTKLMANTQYLAQYNLELDNEEQVKEYSSQIETLIADLDKTGINTEKATEALNNFKSNANADNLQNLQDALIEINVQLTSMSDQQITDYAKSLTAGMSNSATATKDMVRALTEYRDALMEKELQEKATGQVSAELEAKLKATREEIERLATETEKGSHGLSGFTKKMQSFGQKATSTIRGAMTIFQTFESIKGITTEAANGTAKLGSALTSLGSSVMMLIPAISSLGAAFGPWGIAAGIIFSVIAAIVGVIKGLAEADTALDKAKKKVEELKEAYTDAKGAISEFQNTVSNYQEAIDGLDELVKGTKEYEQQLQKANEAARELINSHPELEGKWTFGADGIIHFSDGALDDLENSLNKAVKETGQQVMQAQIEANKLQKEDSLEKLLKSDKVSYNNDKQNEVLDKLLNFYLQNGQQFNEAYGALTLEDKNFLKDLNLEDTENYIKTVAGNQLTSLEYSRELTYDFIKYHEDWNKVAENLKTDLEKNIFTSLVQQNREEIDKLKAEKEKFREDSYLNVQGLRSDLLDIDGKKFTYNKNEETAQEFTTRMLNSLQEIFTKNGFYGEVTLDKETGKLYINGEYIGVLGKSGENQYEFDLGIHSLYPDEVRSPIAKLLSNEDLEVTEELLEIFGSETLDNVNKKIEELDNSFNELGQKAEYFAKEFFKIFDNEDNANKFYTNLLKGRVDFSDLSISDTTSLLGNEVIKDVIVKDAVANGVYKSPEQVEAALNTAQNHYQQWFDNYYKELGQKVPASIANILTSEDFKEKYSKNTQLALEKAFIEISRKTGTNGINIFKDIVKNQKDPIGIIEALNSTDWRTADFDKVYKQLKDLGSDINKADFLKLADQFKEVEEKSWRLTASLEELFEQFKKIRDITDKLTFGAVISDDDYSKYIKDKNEFKDKFVWTINGWMYIGEEYAGKNKALTENSDIQKVREDYAKAREDAAKISEKDLKLSDTELAYQYLGGAYYNPISGELEYKEGYGGRGSINETALAMAEIDKKSLEDALAAPQLEESKKIISAYADAIRELYETSEKYADKNVLTMAVESQYKSVDKLIDKWDDLKETWGDTLTDDVATQLIKIATINEAVAKGIDKDELIDYVKWLRESNAQLAENEELLYQVAVANKIAQKAFKETVSSYEANIEALQFDDSNSETYLKALDNLRQNLADMLSISVEELAGLDASFFTAPEIIELYKAIAEGDEKALQTLTANAMVRAGQIIEAEKDTYIEFLAFMATNPGQAEIDVWYKEHNKPSFLQKNADGTYTRTVAGDAAGLEYDRFGRIASQGSIFDYGAYKGNLNKDKKGKSSKPKELEDELDRYHHIKKVLEDIERELERVAKVKDRAYGAQHLKYLEQEISYLEEEVGLQDQYISQIEGYLGKDRGLIAAYGAQFDEYGNISNYDEMFAANFAKYANAEDSTNWENFKKALSKYEETMDLWQDEVEKRADLIREILDKKLEGISYKVEIEVALSDREIKLLEHQLNRLDDAAYDTAAALANIGQQFEKTQDKIDSVTDGIVETLKTIPGITDERIAAYLAGDGSALDGLDIEQGQIDLLEEYSDQLLELSDTLKELHDKALEQVSAAFDAWNEKIEDHIAKFEHLNNVISNYEEIIGLLGQSNLGITNEFMREMRGQRIANLQGELDTRTRVKDNLAEELAQARQKAAEAASDAEREDWEKVADDIEKRLQEATESWQEAWIAALQANKEAFEQTMQEIVDSFSNYENELKRYDAEQDRYLETYQQAYELSKLTRDIQNSINDQDSIRAKQELQKLESKINDIKKSGRQISQDELSLLQKEYELRLAEIALEDAQNAKSMVRLSRDNEGNWGYVYTADQDKIAEAEQKYEDKLYEYMRQADTMAESASRAILTLNREMAEALAALDVNAEDYEEQVAAITKFYGDQIAYYAEQYNISVDAIETVAKQSAARYKPEVVDIIKSENSGLQTNFEETVLAIIGHFGSMDTAVSEVMGGIQTTYDETIAAFQEYQRQNQETCELAGTDIEHMAQFISGQFTDIQTSAEGVVGHTQELTTGMKTELDKVLTELGTFASKYSEQVGMADTAATGLSGALIELEETLQALSGDSLKTLQKLVDDVTTMAQAVKEAGQAVGDAVDGMSTNPKPGVDISYKIKIEGEYDPRFGESGVWAGLLGQERNPKNKEDVKTSLQTQMYDGARVSMYGTGGYTGEWGDSAKLAGLHEKELVLNQTDTQNILDAVSLIRKMTAGTAQLSSGLGNIGAGLNNLNINPGTMDQNVQISASFPNVSNHYEIEEALNNLVNKASQYAFRPVYT